MTDTERVPTLKELRQTVQHLRRRVGNLVVEAGGEEPPPGGAGVGALRHVDDLEEGLTAHIDAGYNRPEDLGASE